MTATTIVSRNPEETRQLGARLAPLLRAGDFVALEGDLGAGKTLLVQAIAAVLGVEKGVRSPTFVLLHHYPVRLGTIHHFDLYRLGGPDDLDDLGYEEFFYGDGICFVEWAERAGDRLPSDHLVIRLEVGETEDARRITLEAHGPRSADLLTSL